MFRAVRRRRAARRERKRLGRSGEQLTPTELAELERLREQRSPFRAKWGYFPK